MKSIKTLFKILLGLVLFFIGYVIAVLLWDTYKDFNPQNETELAVKNSGTPTPATKSVYSVLTWNIGYAGLGKESSFFFDAGGMLTSKGAQVRPTKKQNKKYFNGIEKFITANDTLDFLLLQEVDTHSKRSFYQNQYEAIGKGLPQHQSSFAFNYKVPYVPLPLLEPWQAWGKINSGIATFSRYPIRSAGRIPLPGNYSYPTRVLQLDRCISLQTIFLDKQNILYLINLHNSAFDDGSLRKHQLEQIVMAARMLYEWETDMPQKVHVILGGDWNQYLPNFTPPEKGFIPLKKQTQIPENTFPKGWQWVYDASKPSNRNVKKAFGKNTKFSLIDGFLVSPSIKVVSVKTQDLDFAYSDHQPITMQFILK